MEAKKNFESSWNLSEHLIDDIAATLHAARVSFRSGEMDSYYWDFYMIRKTLEAFMEEDELKKSIILENEIESLIKVFKDKPITNEDKIKICNIIKVVNKNLKEYDGMVMNLLRKYGFLVPPKKNRTKLIG